MENKEKLKDVTEKIQDECHKFTESILATSSVSYQDATNTFLYMKLAELTIKLDRYEKHTLNTNR
jgi:recombinational DNA repair protein RecR